MSMHQNKIDILDFLFDAKDFFSFPFSSSSLIFIFKLRTFLIINRYNKRNVSVINIYKSPLSSKNFPLIGSSILSNTTLKPQHYERP